MDTDGMQFENPIDNLTYLYDDTNKNQLLRVFDATSNTQGFKDDTDGTDINHDISEAPDYAYDANGNMTEDKNKGIENIVYNHLNLPVEIVFPTGKITYLYNAVGQKVRKTVEETSVTTTTDYLSGFQYKNAVLQFFPHAEGYVNATESTTKGVGYMFNYVFNYIDHLGNIRLSYSKDPATNVLKIIEENHYYPFGLKHSGYNSDKMMYSKEGSTLKIKPVPPLFITSYDKKFNGKSWETELGLNFYDYGARNYDPALGRWMNVDPKAEQSRRWSPYNYCYNNPVKFIDPDGMQAYDPIFNLLGKLIGDDGKNNGKIHIAYKESEANAITKETKNGNKSIDLSDKSIITLHGGKKTVEGVVKSVEATGKNTSKGANDKNMHEEGGHTEKDANGNVSIVNWIPGIKKTGNNNALIKPFNGVTKPNELQLLDYWHVHTSGTIYGTDVDGNEIETHAKIGPSPDDIDIQSNMEKDGFNSTAIQVDTYGVDKVNFYNGTEVIGTMTFDNFIKLFK